MLDQRSQTLLKTLIERYIADGQPVGSRSLSKYSGMDLSPATIRNVMADLEDMGLIASPHTSAGRIPTPRGYRLFVDTLLTVRPFEVEQARELKSHLPQAEPQKIIASAAHLLSNLSQFAGVVLTPRHTSSFRHIEFLRLSEGRVLLIIVTPEGDVQNRILFVSTDYTPTQLIEAGNYLNQHYAGMQFDEIRPRLQSELRQLRDDMSSLMEAAMRAGDAALSESDPIVISGERNLLGNAEMAPDMARLRKMFDVFENKSALLQLLDVGSHAQGVQIYIGGDSDLVPLDDMSVVTAPYEVDGRVVGTLGVIGPTRMAYERVIPIVDITSRLLSNALSQH